MNFLHRSISKITSPGIPILAVLLLCTFSCKEKASIIDFNFQSIDAVYFPKKTILVTFNIIPYGSSEPLSINWIYPDTLKGKGPFRIETSKNLLLNFEITNANSESQNFTYVLMADAYDSLTYDYRNKVIGTYDCSASYSYNGTTKNYRDTLTVSKNSFFNMLYIQNMNDISKNWRGNEMRYNGRKNGDSIIYFYGYHSGVTFSNGCINYRENGPLGFYYTTIYEGSRIK